MKKKYYAVRKGRHSGIFFNWDECKSMVDGYKGAEYKSFTTIEEAEKYLQNENRNVVCFENNTASNKEQVADISIKENELIAYVDGSFGVNDTDYSYGMVIIDCEGNIEKFNEKISDKETASMRNVAGEIAGSMAAMKYALEKNKDIYIFYDYQGIESWCTGAWKTNKDETKKYKVYYDEVTKMINIKFVKVKGHSNNKYNDMADSLAKEALGII